MRSIRERLGQEEGFTLIELMVVVLIIAVLVAIAVPSFLGFRAKAQDRAAQAALRNTLLAEKGVWTDTGAYTTDEATLKAFEPTVEVTTDAIGTLDEADPVAVYLSVSGNDDAVCLVKVADSGNVFAIFDDASATGGTFYQKWGPSDTPACPTSAGAPSGWSTSGFPSS